MKKLETIRDRICRVFEHSGLNQTDFAKKINVTPAYVWKIINREDTTPSERIIEDICEQFNISIDWLKTGEGDMILPPSRAAELSKFAATVFKEGPDSFKSRFLSVLANLNENEWEVLATIAEKLAEKKG
ncbi:MAG: helix-turn-helix transcriptional regulator [Lachnospiraceae bacterium]|nr:helix-turn-helix transcriptional regulator [Lachnospiraceae bacterium]